MSTLFVVLPTLPSDRARHMRDLAPTRQGAKLKIVCRAELGRV